MKTIKTLVLIFALLLGGYAYTTASAQATPDQAKGTAKAACCKFGSACCKNGATCCAAKRDDKAVARACCKVEGKSEKGCCKVKAAGR
jgi:hypothetical protein